MLPTTRSTNGTGMKPFELPRRLLGTNGAGYELFDEDDAYGVRVELPGFDRDEIDVRWDEGRLKVLAEHEDETHNRTKRYRRTFQFPDDIEASDIEAEYENGVLEVWLPKPDAFADEGEVIDIK